jgi:BASS family bile acid:Na+ symporter
MPAAAWLVTRVVPMSTELAAGVILVGCVPGAMASNVLTNTSGGSVAFSVSLTTVATLLSPITVPTALWIFADVQTEQPLMNPTQTAVSLFLKVVLPTIVGYLLARRFEIVRRHSDRWASAIASIALLWIIASVVAGNRSRLIDLSWVLAVALLAINLIGYAGGYLSAVVAGLPDRFRRALTLEVGMQNAGLGTVLATSLYGEHTIATIPTAAYTFGCMLTGTVLAVVWRKRRPCG